MSSHYYLLAEDNGILVLIRQVRKVSKVLTAHST
jgi:hypothetical protein